MEENRDTFQNDIEIDYQNDRKEEKSNLLNKCWSSLSQSCIGRVIRRFIAINTCHLASSGYWIRCKPINHLLPNVLRQE